MKIITIMRKKKNLLLIAVLLMISIFAVIFYTFSSESVALADGRLTENEGIMKSSHNPTLNDDFCDSRVIVTLNQSHSRINGEVRLENFGINLERAGLVNEKTADLGGEINETMSDQSQLRTSAVITDLFRVSNPEKNRLVNRDSFYQILSIELPIRGKDKVLEAIAELEKSEMVFSAEPDYNFIMVEEWAPVDLPVMVD